MNTLTDKIKTENRTWREKRIKELSKAGNNIKEIARILMISERTVSSCFSRHKLDTLTEEFEVYVTVRPKAKNRKLNYEEITFHFNPSIKYCWCCGINESIDICDNCIKEFPIC